jgi:hypothetical protein
MTRLRMYSEKKKKKDEEEEDREKVKGTQSRERFHAQKLTLIPCLRNGEFNHLIKL